MKEVMEKTKLNNLMNNQFQWELDFYVRLQCIKPLFDEFSEEEKSKEQI